MRLPPTIEAYDGRSVGGYVALWHNKKQKHFAMTAEPTREFVKKGIAILTAKESWPEWVSVIP